MKDAFYVFFAINDLLTAATRMIPAPNDCGEGTLAQWRNGQVTTVQASDDNLQVLPTMEEWQKQNRQQIK